MTKFNGHIAVDVRDATPDWEPFLEPRAKEGAPNVLFIVWDDTGFGSWDTYGGLIRMPAMRRIAERGLLFSQFHTTALCSPTRSSLLTGRNAQSNGMGTIGEMADGFPGLSCVIPRENAFLSEILRDQGYNTFALGKWHLSPAAEMSMGTSKRSWPLNRGFDRFYGFLGGLTDQWYPDLTYDNHPVDPPATPDQGYHLSADLADRAIQFIRDSMSTAPGKPWFTYFAPGAGHAPHHVGTEWSDQYRGVFSMGYERYREQVLENQKALGLIPADTQLPPLNPYEDEIGPDGKTWNASDLVQPWDSLSDDDRTLFERQAEVFAGFLTYTDAQIGRLLDFLEETGQLDNTLIVALSDNGASAEGGPTGSVNENRWYNGLPENPELNMQQLPELGLQSTHPHYSNGWAMAFNTPFKLYKTYASVEGGVADPMVIAWPAGLTARGERRDQYLHVTDIVPTVLDLLDIGTPDAVDGIPLPPFEGVSMRAAFLDGGAESAKHEQFYSVLGTRGIWVDGWHASAIHAPTPSGWGHFETDRWELYHLPTDRNQTHDLAGEQPEKLAELVERWHALAQRYNGYPLDDRDSFELLAVKRPNVAGELDSIVLYPNGAPVPEHSVLEILGRSYTISADVRIDDPAAVSGIIYSLGSRFGGHALFARDRRLHYVYNWLGEIEQEIVSDIELPEGETSVGVSYVMEGVEDNVPHGTATLFIGNSEAGSAHIRTQPGYFSISGEGATVGRENGQPVSSSYQPPFSFVGGDIKAVVLDATGEPYASTEIRLQAALGRD